MKDYRKIVASNLSRLMSERDKNQTDLMRDLNLSSATVSSWCTGKKMPRMDKVQILADYFQVEPSDIIEEKSYSLPDPPSSPISAGGMGDVPVTITVTEHERAVLLGYRKAEEAIRNAIDDILHIEKKEKLSILADRRA